MTRGRRVNRFAQRRRNHKANESKVNAEAVYRSTPYEEITRDNELFIKYYKAQNICTDEAEWELFLAAMRENLPVTFHVTGFKREAEALLDILKTQMFTDYEQSVAALHGKSVEEIERPLCLPWYPNGLAYQLELTRKDIRRSEALYKLHNFLIAETNAGSISRQEAVSMIPPIVLNVKPTDKVLDMCAAPGSKTAQLIAALHAEPEKYNIPPGFVIANDVDNARCYMLVHQAKRLSSPCCVITNHDSSMFPNIVTSNSDGEKAVLKFDKILCDVPCSGDGTLRKNPDIWMKWGVGQAYSLHGVQYRIARRGAEMLEVGGRLVYSTCSLNPLENEAVIQRLIRDSNGALELLDATDLVPGLKFKPGMTNWLIPSVRLDKFYENFDEVPTNSQTTIRPEMFPLPEEELKALGIEKCMRVLPHLQNTGGFFVAVIEKRKKLDYEKNDTTVRTDGKNRAGNSAPPKKRRRQNGFKEDPFVFFEPTDTDWPSIKAFYELDDSLDQRCLLTRCESERKRNIYLCSTPVRDLVVNNLDAIKIINTGIKVFARCDNRNTTQAYRLAQEGLQTINAFIGPSRRIEIGREDLILLLNSTDPTNPPSLEVLQPDLQARCESVGPGSCVLIHTNEKFTLHVVGWRGTTSLRAYVNKDESVHILRLIGGDISKFDVNKYEKAREASKTNLDEESKADIDAVRCDINAAEVLEKPQSIAETKENVIENPDVPVAIEATESMDVDDQALEAVEAQIEVHEGQVVAADSTGANEIAQEAQEDVIEAI